MLVLWGQLSAAKDDEDKHPSPPFAPTLDTMRSGPKAWCMLGKVY